MTLPSSWRTILPAGALQFRTVQALKACSMSGVTYSIERLTWPEVEASTQKRSLFRKPFIITDIVPSWSAFGKWSPDSFESRFGDRSVPIWWKVDRKIGPKSAEPTRMTLSDFVKEMLNPADERYEYYIGNLSLERFLPELLDEIDVPRLPIFERHISDFLNFGARVYTQLHYHPYGSALLSLVYGEKLVRIMSPDQTRFLYKYGSFSTSHNFSQIEEWSPDLKKYPKYQQARFQEHRLKAGETLFIPVHWWHGIQNGDPSIAVVTFYKAPFFSKWLPARGLRRDYFLEPIRWLRDK